MSTLASQIKDIELKVKQLIAVNEQLKKERDELFVLYQEQESDYNQLQDHLKSREARIVALKTANSMLGSDDYKTKTKLKINALVKEIDQCIAQLT